MCLEFSQWLFRSDSVAYTTVYRPERWGTRPPIAVAWQPGTVQLDSPDAIPASRALLLYSREIANFGTSVGRMLGSEFRELGALSSPASTDSADEPRAAADYRPFAPGRQNAWGGCNGARAQGRCKAWDRHNPLINMLLRENLSAS